MIPAPMFGWFITPDEIKTKVINGICIALIGIILILYKQWYKKQ